MSDILLYLVDMANKCHVDLPSAVLEKMEHNGKKYPEDKAYGRADKYTELSTTEWCKFGMSSYSTDWDIHWIGCIWCDPRIWTLVSKLEKHVKKK